MTAGPTTRAAGLIATLFASLVSLQAACNSGSPETAFAHRFAQVVVQKCLLHKLPSRISAILERSNKLGLFRSAE